jgi:flagellar protein FlaI
MKMLTPLMAAYTWFALENKALIGIAGPTASGKTSLFTALLTCLEPNSKIITIEDTFEINIPHKHWLPLTGRRSAMIAAGQLEISESELIDIAMRMRPDFLVIGEVRKD